MSDLTTRRMLALYNQEPVPTLFLSSMFRSPPRNFYTSEEVELDIIRSDEDVSVVVSDISNTPRMNSADVSTNKSFKPPIHNEAIPINSFDLLKRTPGQDPFQQPDYRANLMFRIFDGIRKIDAKIRRSMEWQASQVLQTGTVALTDTAGETLYAIDYKPKATHFPTTGTSWSNAAATPDDDIDALALVIRKDGLAPPNEIIFGRGAWQNYIGNQFVQAKNNLRRAEFGVVVPQDRGEGATFMGTFFIGAYWYEAWVYDGHYVNPQTLVKTPFVATDKVIVRNRTSRMDATFGAIPNIGEMIGGGADRLIPELPGRLPNVQGGMDLFTNAWLSEDRKTLFAGVGARPLFIPTAIDTYGCLDTII